MAARGGRLGLGEGLQHARGLLRRHAAAGVGDLKPDAVRRRAVADGQGDRAGLGELERVVDEVVHDLQHAPGVADPLGRGDVAGGGEVEAPLARGEAVQVLRLLPDALQIEPRLLKHRAPGLKPREVEHVVQHPHQRLARLRDHAHHALLAFVERRLRQGARDAQHTVHRRADLVAHQRQKLRFRLGRRLGGLAGGVCGARRRLGGRRRRALFGDVPVHADQPHASVGALMRHRARLDHPLRAIGAQDAEGVVEAVLHTQRTGQRADARPVLRMEQRQPGVAVHRRHGLRTAIDGAHPRVPVLRAAFDVALPHADARRVHRQAKPQRQQQRALLRLALLRRLAHGAIPDYCSVSLPARTGGAGHPDLAAPGVAHAPAFAPDAQRAPRFLQRREHAPPIVGVQAGVHRRDARAGGLRGQAIDILKTAAGEAQPRRALGVDGVFEQQPRRLVGQPRQPRSGVCGLLLRQPHCGLGAAALSDVAHHADEVRRFAARVADRRDGEAHPVGLAVAAIVEQLRRAGLARPNHGADARHLAGVGAVALKQRAGLAPAQPGQRIAAHLLERRVDPDDALRRVGQHH